jgi:hypothetical protein
MIRRFRHRGLQRFYAHNDRRGFNAKHVEKIRRVLAFLDRATRPEHLDLQGSDCTGSKPTLRAIGASPSARTGGSFLDLKMAP